MPLILLMSFCTYRVKGLGGAGKYFNLWHYSDYLPQKAKGSRSAWRPRKHPRDGDGGGGDRDNGFGGGGASPVLRACAGSASASAAGLAPAPPHPAAAPGPGAPAHGPTSVVQLSPLKSEDAFLQMISIGAFKRLRAERAVT